MNVLGINAYHGDVSAALVCDGELVAAVEEERFRRVKHWAGFPAEAIRSCLERGGLKPEDVDRFAVSRDPKAHLWRKAIFALSRRPGLGLVRDRARNRSRIASLPVEIAVHSVALRGSRGFAAPLGRAPSGAPRERVLRISLRGRGGRRHRRVRGFREHVARLGERLEPRDSRPGILSALPRSALSRDYAVSSGSRSTATSTKSWGSRRTANRSSSRRSVSSCRSIRAGVSRSRFPTSGTGRRGSR